MPDDTTVRLGPYRVEAPLGTGPDGATWRGRDVEDQAVQLVRLAAHRIAADRWRQLSRRLRLAAMVDHPAVLAVRPALDIEPPFVAVEHFEQRWDALLGERQWPESLVRSQGAGLALGLTAMHRIGLFAGDLGPTRVVNGRDGAPRIDPTGLRAVEGDRAIDQLCRAPEVDEGAFGRQADVYALGALLVWARFGAPSDIETAPAIERPARWRKRIPTGHPLAPVLGAMLADVPEARPAAARVARALGEAPTGRRPPGSQEGIGASGPLPSLIDVGEPENFDRDTVETAPPTITRVGRFELGRVLGEGAMGRVFLSTDPADGRQVAVKVLRAGLQGDDRMRQRFDKEIRLLRTVNHPRIANLVDAGVEFGLPWLALQFVEGIPLTEALAGKQHFDAERVLRIAADVLRALAAIHAAGIIHRDVKPGNVMVRGEGAQAVAVLCDFGIARHVEQSEDERLTRAGMLVGTPHYMSPEAARGKAVDGRADLYSLGVMAYELFAGAPPFDCPNPTGLLVKHIQEPPPPLGRARPDLGEPVLDWIARLLAKDPADRPANAHAALDEVQRLLRGDATDVRSHPPLPTEGGRVQSYVWSWDLNASPSALWPLVSDTRRINRAMGMTPFDLELVVDEGMAWHKAQHKLAGMEARWREEPMEWVEGRRIGNLRVYEAGPLEWMRAVTDLEPLPNGGTRVTQTVQLLARYGWSRAVAGYEAGIKTRKNYERLFHRLDAWCQGAAGGGVDAAIADPFEGAPALDRDTSRALETARRRLHALDLDPVTVDRLVRFVGESPAPVLGRLRPRSLAARLQVDEAALVDVCLHAVREGLLVLLWDLLCPICRVPADIVETLAEIERHGHCEVCRLDFDLDFAGSVELVFRPHPSVRAVDDAVYCIGGPAQAPHVVVQIRLAPGERLVLNLLLADGTWRLAGRRLPYAAVFRVHPDAPVEQWDVELAPGLSDAIPRSLRSGRQRVILANAFDHDVLLRIERVADREDALTAADAMRIETFRALFPHECLAPGALVNVARITLMRSAICEIGELYADDGPRAFARIHAHFERAGRVVADHGGAVIKMEGEGLVSAFAEPGQAVRAALALGEQEDDLNLRIAVHGGPAYVATLDARLDYFGRTVHQTALLLARARPGEVVVSESTALEPDAARALRARGAGEVVQLSGGLIGLRHRYPRPAKDGAATGA